ncbi:hypothetical protein GQX73_g10797 [Xylaria multiplex]|uniref:Uncharacterized protein n=1 Tax=Xylaria multiplex TaxID=323545 RepID=A0A7C8MZH5_9PEZI|nr:hypothetical protein GQX73_g10797 [Xylaria multiplex]
MWSVGLSAWDMLHAKKLLGIYDVYDQMLNDAHHLANMIALLGPRGSLKGEERTRFLDVMTGFALLEPRKAAHSKASLITSVVNGPQRMIRYEDLNNNE